MTTAGPLTRSPTEYQKPQESSLHGPGYLQQLVSQRFGSTQELEQDPSWQSVTKFNDCQEWAKLMEAAPSALTSLAFCFAVTRFDSATEVKPSYTAKVKTDLKTSITLCYDHGLSAFGEAEDKMKSISRCIANILKPYGLLFNITNAIKQAKELPPGDPQLTAVSQRLKCLLEKLTDAATNCTEESSLVAKKFEDWANLATHINAAFTGSHAKLPKQKVKNDKAESLLGLVAAQHSSPGASGSTGAVANEALDILESCLYDLKTIKKNLHGLKTFFKDFEQEIRNIGEETVQQFALDVEDIGSGGYVQWDSMDFAIMSISLGYTLAGAKADIYSLASRKHLKEGVDLVTDLQQVPFESLGKHIREIAEYSDRTKAAVQKLIANDAGNVESKLQKVIKSH